MISRNMRLYDYFTIGTENEYGESLPASSPLGKVKMAINLTSQSTQNNINYENCQYIGLTHSTKINDNNIIQYGDKKLKVLYVNPIGRLTQVFMVDYD